MDDADRAQAHMEQLEAAALKQRLGAKSLAPSLRECAECGDDIPKARRLALPGVRLCVPCQVLKERR